MYPGCAHYIELTSKQTNVDGTISIKGSVWTQASEYALIKAALAFYLLEHMKKTMSRSRKLYWLNSLLKHTASIQKSMMKTK